MSSAPIKILVVEHEPQAQNMLVKILESDPALSVMGVAGSHVEAVRLMARSSPDLITLDIWLPNQESLALTREIMSRHPVPIVVLGSGAASTGEGTAFDLLEAGALVTLEKPDDTDEETFQPLKEELISTVKTMAEVKLVRRIRARRLAKHSNNSAGSSTKRQALEIVAIGASTGGPGAIQLILKGLPDDFPLPIIIAQHIARGFTDGLVNWLNSTSGFRVKIPAHNDKPEAGTAYLCPEGYNTAVGADGRIKLAACREKGGTLTSISYLFASIAAAHADRSIAVLLTGMGRDGAEELKLIRDNGGITIAQDAESSLVHGMPGEAIAIGAAQHVLACDKIPSFLSDLATKLCRK